MGEVRPSSAPAHARTWRCIVTKAQLSEIRTAVDLGFTLAEARELVLGAPVAAESPVAEATLPKAVPSWIVQHAVNKAARRTLAAQMRAKGQQPKGAAWAKAKKAAGIA